MHQNPIAHRCARLFVAVLLVFNAVSAKAAIFTVGPGGTHASIGEAVAAANASGGGDFVRVASGVYVENVALGSPADEILSISGGWNQTYTTSEADPGLTVLDGGALSSVVSGSIGQGHVEIFNLTVTNGQSSTGGGINVELSGTARLWLEDIVIHGNVATSDLTSKGGGISIDARDDAFAVILNSTIRGNRSLSSGAVASGGGAYLSTLGNAHTLIAKCVLEDNRAQSQSDPKGGGLYFRADQLSSIAIVQTDLRGNSLSGSTAIDTGAGAAIDSLQFGSSSLTLRASRITANRDETRPQGGIQLGLNLVNSSKATIGDSEISDGSGSGAVFRGVHTSSVDLANLTVAGHPRNGLQFIFFDSAGASLFNSILHGNSGVELVSNRQPAPITSGSNLIEGEPGATDPGFVDASVGDYRLQAGSSAIDVGAANVPAGIGNTDADGGTRVVGPGIDLGAFERGSLGVFSHGFED